LCVTLLGVLIRASVDPFPESGLDEAFSFPVGARRVGARKVMAKAELQASLAESARAVAMAVISEQSANANAQGGVISQGSVKKSNCRGAGEVGQDLGEDDAGVIVDGDVEIFPPTMMLPAPAPVGTDGDFCKTAQMFDIEMEQIAGSGVLVANHGHSELQVADAIQTQSAKDAADGGTTQAGGLSDVQAGEALSAKLFDSLH
jgi:hypothetical protein